MEDVLDIIKKLRSDNSSKFKLEVLKNNKDNQSLKDYLYAVYNPRFNYYIKKIPEYSKTVPQYPVGEIQFWALLDNLNSRKLTGNAAIAAVKEFLDNTDEVFEELLLCTLARDIRANLSEKTINKVWTKLIDITPYMRCSKLIDVQEKYFPDGGNYFLQKKADGTFLYLVKDAKSCYAITRQGNVCEMSIIGELLKDVTWTGVLVGEALIKRNGAELNRKTGNGLVTKFLKRLDVIDTFTAKNEHKPNFEALLSNKLAEYAIIEDELHLEVWDFLTLEEFDKEYSRTPYKNRLAYLEKIIKTDNLEPRISLIPTYNVSTVHEAQRISDAFIAEGYEGGVLKTDTLVFENTTSKYQAKIKAVKDCDLLCVGYEYGSGKYEGLLGALLLESADGLLKVKVGTGFSEKDRQNPDEYVGKIIEVKYNEVISKKGSDTKSLFLPVFVEIRDKNQADYLKDID